MKKSPAISLVTIVREGEATLPDTLRSVEAQTCPPAEHVIVDGMSADGSVALCRDYAARVPWPVTILSRPPRGVYDALNAGLAAVHGEVVGLLHGGDRFASPSVLETVVGAFEADQNLMLAYADIRYMKPSGRPGRYYSGAGFTPSMLKWGCMPPHPSVYVRRSLLRRYGPYAVDYRVAGDFEWLVRALLGGGERSRYLPLCAVLMGPGGISTSLHNRLFVTPREKLRALRSNGFRLCPLRMAGRYAFALTSIFKKRND